MQNVTNVMIGNGKSCAVYNEAVFNRSVDLNLELYYIENLFK